MDRGGRALCAAALAARVLKGDVVMSHRRAVAPDDAGQWHECVMGHGQCDAGTPRPPQYMHTYVVADVCCPCAPARSKSMMRLASPARATCLARFSAGRFSGVSCSKKAVLDL